VRDPRLSRRLAGDEHASGVDGTGPTSKADEECIDAVTLSLSPTQFVPS